MLGRLFVDWPIGYVESYLLLFYWVSGSKKKRKQRGFWGCDIVKYPGGVKLLVPASAVGRKENPWGSR